MFKLILIFAIFVPKIRADYKTCVVNNTSINDIDANVAKLLNVGKNLRKFPVNRIELGPYCDEQRVLVKQIEDYKNGCMRNLPKQLTSITIYTLKRLINTLCKKNSKKVQGYLDSAHCANSARKYYNKCNNDYINALQGALKAPDKLKIPYFCCEYYKIFDCMRDGAVNVGACNEVFIASNQDYFGSIFQNTIDFLCGDYLEDSDKCQKLPPVPPKNPKLKTTESFLIPFIDLLDSFPEIDH